MNLLLGYWVRRQCGDSELLGTISSIDLTARKMGTSGPSFKALRDLPQKISVFDLLCSQSEYSAVIGIDPDTGASWSFVQPDRRTENEAQSYTDKGIWTLERASGTVMLHTSLEGLTVTNCDRRTHQGLTHVVLF